MDRITVFLNNIVYIVGIVAIVWIFFIWLTNEDRWDLKKICYYAFGIVFVSIICFFLN